MNAIIQALQIIIFFFASNINNTLHIDKVSHK